MKSWWLPIIIGCTGGILSVMLGIRFTSACMGNYCWIAVAIPNYWKFLFGG